MKCESPILIKNQNPYRARGVDFAYIRVPCGQCRSCLANKQNDWLIRLSEEAKGWKYFGFQTLTYSPERLNNDLYLVDEFEVNGKKVPFYSLSKDDAKRFLDKVRKRCKRAKIEFKYYLCGEYGEKHLRPHYHCIWYFNDERFVNIANDVWTYGRHSFTRNNKTFQFFNPISYDSIVSSLRYVTKYVTKECCHPYFNTSQGWHPNAEKPFHLQSKSLGSDYLFSERMSKLGVIADNPISKTKLDLSNLLNYQLPNGKRCPLPRYYRDKLFRKTLQRFYDGTFEQPCDVIYSYDKVSGKPKTQTITNAAYRAFKDNLQLLDNVRLSRLKQAGFKDEEIVRMEIQSDSKQIEVNKNKLSRMDGQKFYKSVY